MKKITGYLVWCILLFGICGTRLQVQAAGKQTIYNSPYVFFSPDGMAWTTNAGDANFSWYPSGEKVETGIASSLRELKTGEHYYRYSRKDEIPIGYWQVEHRPAHCIHRVYPPEGDAYYGLAFGRQICGRSYYSGWQAYCADCGENVLNFYVYMSRSAAQSIRYIPLRTSEGNSFTYYYLCPHCSNLEQGVKISDHQCTTISNNRYKVIYHPNVPKSEEGRAGVMDDSIHMYDNAAIYEENPVTPITRLTKNSYIRVGYVFDGWNTKADGSGTAYTDGQRILNLTTENCDDLSASSGEKGVVTLYAQWRQSESTLVIQPNGGTYGGRKTDTRIQKAYGESYFLNTATLTTPAGYTISFQTNGGTSIPPITGTTHFKEWKQEQPFLGQMYDPGTAQERYLFTASDGQADTLTAQYEADGVALPGTARPGYSFGGWYQDPEFRVPAGGVGDVVTPGKNITLYAQWVDLTLRAKDNYVANGGKGAVDLSWSQADGNNKVYLLYQSRDGTNWTKINDSADIGNGASVNRTFSYTGSVGTYTIPYTGLYTLTAAGARGGNYAQYLGGYGGTVTMQIWLSKGEVLTYAVGGINSYNCGGSGSAYGNGGGMTNVISNRKGTLLIGAGGGGASPAGNGGAGGSTSGITGTYNQGQSGMAGGGGGYYGGRQGEYVVHSHTWGVCNHVHAGNASFGGGCYVKSVCDGQIINVVVGRYYGNRDYSGKLIYCPQCAGYSCGGHDKIGQKCSVCNRSYTYGESLTRNYKCDADSGYQLGCGKTESYICGYYQGQVVSAKPGYGGSNYCNTSYARSYATQNGAQNGNGYLVIRSEAVGYNENLSLENVIATDTAKPDPVEASLVEKTAGTDQWITVSWKEPKDQGTTYFHRAESYLAGSANVLCKSNTTSNTLISGVKGYYVQKDSQASTRVTAHNGVFQSETKFVTKIGEETQYLHIAAVDVAGNVSDTIHVNLGARETNHVAWKLYTGKMTIGEGDNVHPASENAYYVRSDGSTPIPLQMTGYMDGFPTRDYQPNETIFEITSEGKKARSIAKTENHAITEGEIRTDGGALEYTEEGTSYLKRYPYAYTIRKHKNAELAYIQQFILDQRASGKIMDVIPIVGASFDGQMVYSDYQQDQSHGIRLIADGTAPKISGLEMMEQLNLINREEQKVHLDVIASDDLSGVRTFYVKIFNTDNAIEQTYMPGEDGSVSIDMTAEDPVFSGDFTVTAYAVDHVGNESTLQYGTTEFQLAAKIERILEPHDPLFKRGESGILTITTWGYAEKVEVIFPEKMTAWNPDLNHVYYYTDSPNYRQEETLQFMVPLRTPENGDFEITVKAYKGDKKLEEHPSLKTLSVDGSVLDDVRTRLR